MGKLTKKLVIYLDQNFLSEMAKTEINKAVNPIFNSIFGLLHQGFLDEKLLVPRSFFHDVETSLAPKLQELVQKSQGYLGQVELRSREEIEYFQTQQAARLFLGLEEEPITWDIVFWENPDNRTNQFDIRASQNFDSIEYNELRKQTAKNIDAVRNIIITNELTFKEQLKKELQAQGQNFLCSKTYQIKDLFSNQEQKIFEFSKSEYFKNIPVVRIYCQMWSKILVHYSNRKVQTGDDTDIEILSAYLPCIDVIATDSFMGQIVKVLKLDSEFSTQVFTANIKGLEELESFLIEFLKHAKPVNKPIVTVFIWADKKIKENSFRYFHTLGQQVKGIEALNGVWIELYAFNDGDMPEYYDPRIKANWPFYGLQDVSVIRIEPSISRLEILEICKEKSRSDKFVLIDSYQKLPDNFIKTLVNSCRSRKQKILKYDIINKTS
ncbi:MAG: hypothetical protein JSW64_12065 [Candidatus Zixiibacteriota bacterium]|nr:MAG: hypothetical protein JSW64_12065 [candidate division Zixibacteria bacterium]